MIRKHVLLRVIGSTAFLFGLLVWIYVVAVQLMHPGWVTEPFSHVNFFPFNWRVDEAGMTAFAVAVVGFLVWQIELHGNEK